MRVGARLNHPEEAALAFATFKECRRAELKMEKEEISSRKLPAGETLWPSLWSGRQNLSMISIG